MAFGDCWEEYFSNKSFASELALSREASKHIDENLIFCPDGGFQVWTIEGSISEVEECGGGEIELKLTSCGRGLQLVDPHIPTREILHVAYLSWFVCFCGIFPAQGFSPVTLVTVCPLRIDVTSSLTAGETIIIILRGKKPLNKVSKSRQSLNLDA